MLKTVIDIDEARCDGCGLCVIACHERAIGLVDGKARLLKADHCDGLGDCLPACPAGAISFVEGKAASSDPPAADGGSARPGISEKAACSSPCPGSAARAFGHDTPVPRRPRPGADFNVGSHLTNWPVQIKLAPLEAASFHDADLLVAADCTAFACGGFHRRFMDGKTVLIGCPKLDGIDYSEKLEAIFRRNDIRSIETAIMEVPCCRGLRDAVERALSRSGKHIPSSLSTIPVDGSMPR